MATSASAIPVRPVALAAVRIYVGLNWLIHAIGKFQDPNFTVVGGTCERIVRGMIGDNPGGYHDFAVNVILPHIETFALLVQYGELLVGVSLLLGAITWLGALGGAFLSANYFLVKGSLGHVDAYAALDFTTLAFSLACLILPTGRAFGLDGWLFRKRT